MKTIDNAHKYVNDQIEPYRTNHLFLIPTIIMADHLAAFADQQTAELRREVEELRKENTNLKEWINLEPNRTFLYNNWITS
jgi:hypothetical protein